LAASRRWIIGFAEWRRSAIDDVTR